MSPGNLWFEKIYSIKEPSSDEVLRCAIALCGGQVKLAYLKKFISMNEMYFPIFHTKSLEKHEILCDGEICIVTNFEYNDRTGEVCKHLMNHYKF